MHQRTRAFIFKRQVGRTSEISKLGDDLTLFMRLGNDVVGLDISVNELLSMKCSQTSNHVDRQRSHLSPGDTSEMIALHRQESHMLPFREPTTVMD
jgi:hypothetical protein